MQPRARELAAGPEYFEVGKWAAVEIPFIWYDYNEDALTQSQSFDSLRSSGPAQLAANRKPTSSLPTYC